MTQNKKRTPAQVAALVRIGDAYINYIVSWRAFQKSQNGSYEAAVSEESGELMLKYTQSRKKLDELFADYLTEFGHV